MSTPFCAEFETALSDYRDGTLAAPAAARMRLHLAECTDCAARLAEVNQATAWLAALPSLEPPPTLVTQILAQTLAPRQLHRSARAGFFPKLWAACTSPRFALAVAMSVFTVAVLLNAADINLRQVSLRQLTPSSLTSSLQRQVDRAWARGVSYYHDLRVVYEIEAAIHQMRQSPAAPAGAAPGTGGPGGHDRSQRRSPGPAGLTVAALWYPTPLSRRLP